MSLFLFACQSDEEALRENVGYLRVALEQSKDVNTKAAAYNPKQMHVVIKDVEGEIVKDLGEDHTKWETNEIAWHPANIPSRLNQTDMIANPARIAPTTWVRRR